MNVKNLRNAAFFLLVVSPLATSPALAADIAGSGATVAERIVSGTEDFFGPGGAKSTRAAAGTEDFVGAGGVVAVSVAFPSTAPVTAKAGAQCALPKVWKGSACVIAANEMKSQEAIN